MHYSKLLFTFCIFIIEASFSYAQKNESSMVFDGFDEPHKKTSVSWFTYNDSALAGKSSGTNRLIKEQGNQYMQFTYTLDQGKCMWNPFSALSSAIASGAFPNGIQAISYRFKGNAHILIVKTANIKDYCYYNIDIPASAVWTTVTIPISELKQPFWGAQQKLEMHAFEGLSWQFTGKTNDTGTISVDDVHLLYTPQLAINPKPEVIAPKYFVDYIIPFHSNILNEEREVSVYLPPSYDSSKSSSKKYPVVYVLDGDSHIQYMSGLIEKLSAKNYNTAFPEMIVVGIANTNRIRDFSPTHITSDPFDASSKRFDPSGGGAAFMSFIEKELMPMIENMYPTTNYKTFVGHSLGGLTVLHTLINKPYLFDAYLALDPSLWWDDELLLKQLNATFGKINLHNKKLFIAVANTMYAGVDTAQVKNDHSGFSMQLRANLNFIDALKKYSITGLTWNYVYYPDEDHLSVTDAGELDGMKYFFELKQSDINTYFKIQEIPFGAGFSISNTRAPADMGYNVYPPEKLIGDYGYACLAKKDYTRALSLFQYNAANYPHSPFVFAALGDYYAAMGDIENARKNYSQALSLGQGRLSEVKQKLDHLN